jgi:hypothetical protein
MTQIKDNMGTEQRRIQVPQGMKRRYSTKEGTIGAGEEGVGGKSMKEAPEHLNAKEKEIWGLLMTELAPSELEVC